MQQRCTARFDTVRLTIRGPAAVVTIDRESRMNSLYGQVYDDLHRALDAAEADPQVRVVVLTGAGDRAFCAGGDKDLDIAQLGEQSAETAVRENDRGQDLVRRLHRLRLPTIARVNGAAVGGGLDLVLACDLVIAAEHARFGSAWILRGIVPAYGAAWLLPRIVGHKRATELVLTGRIFGAEEAGELGIVSEVVPAAELDAAVERLVATLAERSALALDLSKRLLREAPDTGFDAHLEAANLAVHVLSGTESHRVDAERVTQGHFDGAGR